MPDPRTATPTDKQAQRRFDPDATSLTAAPQTDLIPGQDPNFWYQWVHRENLGTYMRPKTIGDAKRGMHRIPAWELVRDDLPEILGRGSDAQGTAIDSAMQHGRMVAIRIPKKYHDLMEADLAKLCKQREASMKKGEERKDAVSRTRIAVSGPEELPSFMTSGGAPLGA